MRRKFGTKFLSVKVKRFLFQKFSEGPVFIISQQFLLRIFLVVDQSPENVGKTAVIAKGIHGPNVTGWFVVFDVLKDTVVTK